MGRGQTAGARSIDGNANFSTHPSRTSDSAYNTTAAANSERDHTADALDDALSVDETARCASADKTAGNASADETVGYTSAGETANMALAATRRADAIIATSSGDKRAAVQGGTFSGNGSTLDAKKANDWGQTADPAGPRGATPSGGARRRAKAGARHYTFRRDKSRMGSARDWRGRSTFLCDRTFLWCENFLGFWFFRNPNARNDSGYADGGANRCAFAHCHPTATHTRAGVGEDH